jgi:hypothetical protein
MDQFPVGLGPDLIADLAEERGSFADRVTLASVEPGFGCARSEPQIASFFLYYKNIIRSMRNCCVFE